MKTSNKLLIGGFAGLVLFATCILIGLRLNVVSQEVYSFENGYGESTTVKTDVEKFTQLRINQTPTVTLKKAESNYVEITVGENLHEVISMDINKEGRLDIRFKDNTSVSDLGFFDIEIGHTEEIEVIEVRDIVKFTTEDVLTHSPLMIIASDLSTFNGPVDTENLNVRARDNSKVNITGKAQLMNATTSDIAKMRLGSEFVADNLTISSKDNSKASLRVNETISAEATDIARISIYGEPQILMQKIRDMGDIDFIKD